MADVHTQSLATLMVERPVQPGDSALCRGILANMTLPSG
jgi:hypothetical protein